VLFVLLVTANGAGYRYGAADQAFYIPAVIHSLEPAAFPRDAGIIDAESRFMVVDEALAGLVRTAGVSLETLFFGSYLLTLVLIWTATVLIGSRVYAQRWATIALAAALTLRHRIPQTSANSTEPYFLPRMLAFALGMFAVAAVLHRRPWAAVGLVALAGLVHVTTGMWFAVLIGVALAVLDRQWRGLGIAAAASAAALLAWAVTLGPLQAANTVMDATWLQAVASKDSLFASAWPIWAWLANLGMLAVLWWAYLTRARRDAATPEDRALVWGASALVVLFLITLPVVTIGWAVAVQLQISRVFWLVDLLTTIYLIGVISDAGLGFTVRRAKLVAAALLAVSVGRGTYILVVQRPDRILFETSLPASPWHDAMSWVRRQPLDVHVLADPGHAWKYGTSVRVAGQHDVFLEEVKDAALAIYSREVAARVVERTGAIGDFEAMTADRARALAQRYAIDVLVTTADLPLPLAYRNARFRIYRLR
jgi:hypothetical protein